MRLAGSVSECRLSSAGIRPTTLLVAYFRRSRSSAPPPSHSLDSRRHRAVHERGRSVRTTGSRKPCSSVRSTVRSPAECTKPRGRSNPRESASTDANLRGHACGTTIIALLRPSDRPPDVSHTYSVQSLGHHRPPSLPVGAATPARHRASVVPNTPRQREPSPDVRETPPHDRTDMRATPTQRRRPFVGRTARTPHRTTEAARCPTYR